MALLEANELRVFDSVVDLLCRQLERAGLIVDTVTDKIGTEMSTKSERRSISPTASIESAMACGDDSMLMFWSPSFSSGLGAE